MCRLLYCIGFTGFCYAYDHTGRPLATFQKINEQAVVVLAHQVYNELGQLKEKKLHNDLQSTSLAYNERGWMTGSSSNEFSMELRYNENIIGEADAQFNGNIANQLWGQGNSLPYSFGYRYDKLNRLKKGITAGLTNVMSEQMEYDVMGNFKWLSRDGGNANHYDYPHGNQLWYVAYVTNGYAYDANGNATTDGRSGYSIQYNHLNLPRYIPDVKLTYTYDATGRKISKNNNGSFRNYIDGIEYKSDGTIDFIQTAEGLAQNNGGTYTYHYNLSDHLGNVRYSFEVSNGVIGKLEQTDYYPFGMKRNTFASGVNNKYLYNGKEMQDELGPPGQEGHYDYGTRFYDPVIGRWNVVDPMAEKREWLSAYNYVQNNPILRVDPTGAFDWVMDANNKPYWDEKATSQATTKAGETYLGKSVQYETKEGYGISLNPDKTWNYQLADLSDKTPVGSRWSDFQSALGTMQPALKAAEITGEVVAAVASGGIAGGEIGAAYLAGQAGRNASFVSSLNFSFSTGRTVATTLTEQLSMAEVTSNPAVGRVIMNSMKDTRWLG